MGDVIQLRPRIRFERFEISQEQAEEINSILARSLSECPACRGRGLLLFKHPRGFLDHAPCPCGGDDENRIDADGFDGPEAA
jgi:hypothetical protein